MDAQLIDAPVQHFKGHHGLDQMEPLAATGAWIQEKNSLLVAFSFEDVGMTKHQEVGSFALKLFLYLGREDMGHPDAHPFPLEMDVFGKLGAHDGVINIAVAGNQGRPGSQPITDPKITDITSVPDFITVAQDRVPARLEIAVCVRQEPDFQDSTC